MEAREHLAGEFKVRADTLPPRAKQEATVDSKPLTTSESDVASKLSEGGWGSSTIMASTLQSGTESGARPRDVSKVSLVLLRLTLSIVDC